MEKQRPRDIQGEEVITKAIRTLLNSFPDLDIDDEILFNTLPDESGKAFFPTNGSAIVYSREDITEHIYQECAYPMMILFRTSPKNENVRVRVKEWLDTLGKWLEKQPIVINGETHILGKYPELTGGRKFDEIKRTTPAFLSTTDDNGTENWAIQILVTYINEFDR